MTSICIDGDKLLRDLRRPYFTIAMLREMKVGDYFELFDVSMALGKSEKEDYPTASARIERVKGGIQSECNMDVARWEGQKARAHVRPWSESETLTGSKI